MSNNNYNNSVTVNSVFVLLILQFNGNGLKNHAHELESVLGNKRIDIAILPSYPKLTSQNIHISGYSLIKSNHPDNIVHGDATSFFFFFNNYYFC